ncbi:MAG: hypothetical protein IT185_00700 [Acidobacteria bacterium]|nr:hypothetical protein [Acidobacteriota bacterium]
MSAFLRDGAALCIAAAFCAMVSACSGSPTSPGTSTSVPVTVVQDPVGSTPSPVYVVLFTHIEDNKPAGALGSTESRASYLKLRGDLITMGETARRSGVAWVLQPDWKILEAARRYEDESTMASTGGRNILRYLRDTLGAVIDPHSHETTAYNYTDVAHLLDLLGVGGSTVVGGHIWDPSLPQFAEWDRFRAPVAGRMFPQASWRGDILMGAATPNHVNDPTVSGVWRPRNRGSYFTDDPTGNIVSIGGFTGDVAGVSELWNLGKAGTIGAGCMLTATYHITSADFATPARLADVERHVIAPLVSLRSAGQVVLTDFTSLVSTWRTEYNAKGCLYQQ